MTRSPEQQKQWETARGDMLVLLMKPRNHFGDVAVDPIRSYSITTEFVPEIVDQIFALPNIGVIDDDQGVPASVSVSVSSRKANELGFKKLIPKE